jgi:hypothetical protein
MAVQVISLKCPECASPLAGFEKDEVFFCPRCRMGWEVAASGKKAPIKVSYARALKVPERYGACFYLPFYLYRLVLHPDLDSASNPRIMELVANLRKVYVPAYHMIRESYYCELGLIYTEAKVVFEEDPDVGEADRKRIGSAIRTREGAAPYLYFYPLQIIDKRLDVTGREYKMKTDFERIWAVPFFDLGDQIQEGILGKTFPAIILDTISDFRAVNS